MSALYKFVDESGDCIYNVLVCTGATEFEILPPGSFSIETCRAEPLSKPSTSKFDQYRLEIETNDLLVEEEHLGPNTLIEFNKLSWARLTFTRKDSTALAPPANLLARDKT